MNRGELIALLTNATAGWPLTASAQQRAMPVIGFLGLASPSPFALVVAAFRQAVQMRLAGNIAERNSGTRTHQPSLLAGLVFDTEGNRMTPSYAVKKFEAKPRNSSLLTRRWSEMDSNFQFRTR